MYRTLLKQGDDTSKIKRQGMEAVSQIWHPALPKDGKPRIVVKYGDEWMFFVMEERDTATELIRVLNLRMIRLAGNTLVVIKHSQGGVIGWPVILGPADKIQPGEAYEVVELGMAVSPGAKVG